MLFTLDSGPSMASWSLGFSVHLEITARQNWHCWSARQLPLSGRQTGQNNTILQKQNKGDSNALDMEVAAIWISAFVFIFFCVYTFVFY